MKPQYLIFVALLAACNLQPFPVLVLSGSLEPKALQSRVEVGIGDTTGQNANQVGSGRLVLVAGRLPSQPFATQKSDLALAVNASALESSKKAELLSTANMALDKLEADLNAALDSIPRRMTIQPTADRIGDLVNANFVFQTKTGLPFTISPSSTVIAIYNLVSTDFNITSFGFARGDGNQNTILGAIAGCQFQGALSKPNATHACGATGILAVNNVGAISIGISLTIELGFTRD